jgi:hypothetical protein
MPSRSDGGELLLVDINQLTRTLILWLKISIWHESCIAINRIKNLRRRSEGRRLACGTKASLLKYHPIACPFTFVQLKYIKLTLNAPKTVCSGKVNAENA